MDAAGFIVTPGASAGPDNRTLVALDDGLDLPVSRFGFKGRAESKVFAQLGDERDRFARELGVDPSALLLGGRSFGGRMCSMFVADGHLAAGLVLLSYPLHPPGKSDRLRVDHFPAIDVPCLFVSGTRDPFGTPEELEHHTAAIPGPVTHVWLDGQAHSPSDDTAVVAAVADWLGS